VSKSLHRAALFPWRYKTIRGVAQLIARSVWDREVEGLSPFTPTKINGHHLMSFYFIKAKVIINIVTPKFIRKQIRLFKRWQKNDAFKLSAIVALLLAGLFVYAGYMGNQRLSANPESYKPLLNLIAQVESSGNYNAHYSNPRNNSIKFTDMSVAEVMKWQKDYVAKGNPSSAVGRYQIINTTLEGLVSELSIKSTQKFDPPTQDKMAIALLERRGAEQYVNNELSKEEFAANLAKEWAALPKVIGDNPEQSYYAGDGLNKSHIKPEKVLWAIEPIEAVKP
jgi:muramidase (phage lysozyme)